ncbi:hypothetical protein RRG08_049666 [Elysia crispata]|uniref:Uncharacterized protein n=1 Tax=Elysia crispata TaxID=231223 RepID=A0AAE0Y6H7_9GAST|nr:hypothetical protein RRG08_049666 [Elysia crispata]
MVHDSQIEALTWGSDWCWAPYLPAISPSSVWTAWRTARRMASGQSTRPLPLRLRPPPCRPHFLLSLNEA